MWKFCVVLVILPTLLCLFNCLSSCLEIHRLSVPRWVRNGTADSVVLDCEYSYNESDLRLVVKWFFDDRPEPVYLWIPELNLRHNPGMLRNRLDMNFVVNSSDAYSRFRALKIVKPTTELSGKYTCQVTSLAGQDSREQSMVIYVPAREFELSYTEQADGSVNVSCEALGLYPSPLLKIFLRPTLRSVLRSVPEVTSVTRTPYGAYDVHLNRKFNRTEVSAGSVFKCELELPGTNYVKAKRIAYYPVSSSVYIRRLSVPRWVRNGTADSVVLDCEYSYNENDLQLVVKWFFDDRPEPVYQWIPELNLRHTSGVLRNRLDKDFVGNKADAYSRYRALRILNPTTELSGKYTCLVTSLAGQDSREQSMIIYVPEREFELSYTEQADGSINASCDALGLYPTPLLKLFLRDTAGNTPRAIPEVTSVTRSTSSGTYDVHLYRTFSATEVYPDVVFECVLELPGTDYIKAKRIAYYPGMQGRRIDAPHGLSSRASSSSTLYSHLLQSLTAVLFYHELISVIYKMN